MLHWKKKVCMAKLVKIIDALTTDRVTGSLSIMDWRKESGKWKHLQGIQFPKQRSASPIVDILIGVDNFHLHCKYEKVCQGSQSRDERLLAGLTSELQTAIQDIAFKLISFTLTLPERRQSWRKLRQLFIKFWVMEAVNTEEPVMSFECRVGLEK